MICKRCGKQFTGSEFTDTLSLQKKICDACVCLRVLQFCYTDEELSRMKGPDKELVFPNVVPERK